MSKHPDFSKRFSETWHTNGNDDVLSDEHVEALYLLAQSGVPVLDNVMMAQIVDLIQALTTHLQWATPAEVARDSYQRTLENARQFLDNEIVSKFFCENGRTIYLAMLYPSCELAADIATDYDEVTV